MFLLITHAIRAGGVAAVFWMMLLENIFPPIPSEIIMPLAGYQAGLSGFSLTAVILAGTAGSVLGGMLWYVLGRWLGIERVMNWSSRHGRWLTLDQDELLRAEGWFKRFGPLAICLGRTLPGVRGVICIPAGIAGMPFASFIIWSSLGSLIWSTLLTLAGYVLQSRYNNLERFFGPLTTGFTVLCATVYVYRLWRFGK